MLTSLLISLIVIYGSIIAPAITNSYASVFDVFITVYIMGVVCMMLSLIILNTFLIGSLCEHFTQVIQFLKLNKDNNNDKCTDIYNNIRFLVR